MGDGAGVGLGVLVGVVVRVGNGVGVEVGTNVGTGILVGVGVGVGAGVSVGVGVGAGVNGNVVVGVGPGWAHAVPIIARRRSSPRMKYPFRALSIQARVPGPIARAHSSRHPPRCQLPGACPSNASDAEGPIGKPFKPDKWCRRE